MHKINLPFNALHIVLLISVLAACASQPRSTYPVLEQILDVDDNLGCNELEDELLKANAIRDAIYEEHGDVLKDAYASTALDLAIDPVSGLLSSMINGVLTYKESTAYIEAEVAAGLRMEQILVYKAQRDCPSGETGDSSQTERVLLKQLKDLQIQLSEEEITQEKYVSERQTVLDLIR